MEHHHDCHSYANQHKIIRNFCGSIAIFNGYFDITIFSQGFLHQKKSSISCVDFPVKRAKSPSTNPSSGQPRPKKTLGWPASPPNLWAWVDGGQVQRSERRADGQSPPWGETSAVMKSCWRWWLSWLIINIMVYTIDFYINIWSIINIMVYTTDLYGWLYQYLVNDGCIYVE